MQVPVQQYIYPNDHYLKLRFRGEIVTFERPHITYVEAISKSPCFENGLLNFPPPFDQNDLGNFRQFLFSNNFAPSLPETLQQTAAKSTAGGYLAVKQEHGPPYISKPTISGPDSPPYLMNSVSSFNLAQRLNFAPLKAKALQRMDSLPFTYEDPVMLLNCIYCSGTALPPATEMRLWVKRWLCLQLPVELFGEYAKAYVTNLMVLHLSSDYSDRFYTLKEKSRLLDQDVAEAQQDLALKTWAPHERSPLPQAPYNPHSGTASIPTSVNTPSWNQLNNQFAQTRI